MRTLLLLLLCLGLWSCASKPQRRDVSPPEDQDDKPPPPGAPAPDLAPAPVEAPAAVQAEEPECATPRDCRRKLGRPGRGARWTCTEGKCASLKKKRRRH